jgi:hypothetical protein
MSCTNSVSILSAESYRRYAYLDPEVSVQQELEFKALVSLIAYSNHCLQSILAQSDAVHQTEVQRPCLAVLLADAIAVETKVELYGACVECVFSG